MRKFTRVKVVRGCSDIEFLRLPRIRSNSSGFSATMGERTWPPMTSIGDPLTSRLTIVGNYTFLVGGIISIFGRENYTIRTFSPQMDRGIR